MNQTTRLIAHGILGACLGFLTSIVFLIIYYGASYTLPITDAVRLRFAFWDAVMLSAAIFAVMFWRDIATRLKNILPAEEDDDETE